MVKYKLFVLANFDIIDYQSLLFYLSRMRRTKKTVQRRP